MSVSSLNGRECQVMELLAEGKSNLEIATLLEVVEVTIEKRLTKIYRKLGVRDRLQAVLVWKAHHNPNHLHNGDVDDLEDED